MIDEKKLIDKIKNRIKTDRLKYDQIKEDIHPVVFYFEKKEGAK